MKGGIYMIRNLLNGKGYIGKTTRMSKRLREHKTELIRGNHFNPHLQAAWNKYGKRNFSFTILEFEEDIDVLNEKELMWVLKLETNNRDKGYNICLPGNTNIGVGKHSEETKELMRQKRFATINGGFDQIKYNQWKLELLERSNRIKRRGYKGDVLVFNKDSGEFVERFKTPLEASEILKLPRKKISAVLNKEVKDYKTGKIQRSYGGYRFVYEKEYKPGDEKVTGYHIQKKLIKVYNTEGVFQGEFYNARQASEFIGCKWSTLNASIHKGGKLKNGWWAER